MLSGHLSSLLAAGGLPAASLPALTDLRGSLLDTLSLPFTRLNLLRPPAQMCVCVCMCEEKEKFRSGLCSSVSAVDAVWRGCGACVSTDTDPVCCCVAGHREIESIREMKSEGVVRAAYQNLKWIWIQAPRKCSSSSEDGTGEEKKARVGRQAKSSTSICPQSPVDSFHMFHV